MHIFEMSPNTLRPLSLLLSDALQPRNIHSRGLGLSLWETMKEDSRINEFGERMVYKVENKTHSS